MDTQAPEKSNLPISGGLIVIAMMMGVLFVTQLPLKSSRPISSGGFGSIYGPQNIPARLWEDPFIPVQKYINSKKKKLVPVPTPIIRSNSWQSK